MPPKRAGAFYQLLSVGDTLRNRYSLYMSALNVNVFDFKDYREFLSTFISQQPKGGWGWRMKVARWIGTQSQFVSQVLSGKNDFSLEHAAQLADALDFTPQEKEYFILLVSYARAGTQSLKDFFGMKIESLCEPGMPVEK